MIAQLSGRYLRTRPGKIVPRLLSYLFFEGRPATTRGRWFNPITFAALRASCSHERHPGSESPLFITGTGRSGSTILGMVLSIHPDAGYLNEPKALWFTANADDDLIGSYSNGDAAYVMESAHANPEIAARVKSMYSSFLSLGGSTRIVDKFPEMIFRIGYLEAIFSNARYIFLYRNPWDTIASTAAWSVGHYNAKRHENWWGVNNRKWNLLLEQVVPKDPMLAPDLSTIQTLVSDTDKAAVEWIATMNRGLAMQKDFPQKMCMVKYESLCAGPEKVLREICVFAGLRHDDEMIRFGTGVLTPPGLPPRPELHPLLANHIQNLSETFGYPN